jgi:prepilin signal peptidase PulO-like enzyme (type II secretory pathway)
MHHLAYWIIGGFIHGLIYAFIFKLFDNLSLGTAFVIMLIGVFLFGVIYWLYRLIFRRGRGRY